jgi:hypothetical protein
MPYARWIEGVRSLVLAGLLAGGCGGDDARPGDAAEAGAAKGAGEGDGTVEGGGGDPLLRRAREGIREGALPQELRAEVLGSTAPEHARARRVLLAMDEPPPGGEGRSEDDDEGSDDARPRPPPILPPSEAEAAALPEPSEPSRSEASGRASPKPPSSVAGADRPVRAKAHAEVGGLSLRTSKGGATLVIAASSSLVVGVANQPSSGIVRLMIDAADAGRSVLTARPRTEGAAVTGVRKGQGTVQITVTLEPGWRLGSVQPFSGGAKVHLVAPP